MAKVITEPPSRTLHLRDLNPPQKAISRQNPLNLASLILPATKIIPNPLALTLDRSHQQRQSPPNLHLWIKHHQPHLPARTTALILQTHRQILKIHPLFILGQNSIGVRAALAPPSTQEPALEHQLRIVLSPPTIESTAQAIAVKYSYWPPTKSADPSWAVRETDGVE